MIDGPIEDRRRIPLPPEPATEIRGFTIPMDAPYILIRAEQTPTDDPEVDDVALRVDHNDEGPNLALLYIMSLPAEQNPLTAAVKAVIDAQQEHSASTVREVLTLFAEFCDIPMPESGK